MPPKDKSKDLTPEERLFKLIQEGEKAEEKDDTLVTSSEAPVLKPLIFEEDVAKGGPAQTSGGPVPALDSEIREKKALRVGLFKKNRRESFSFGAFQNFLSLRVLNRVLMACFLIALFYFVNSHGLGKKSSDDDFMQKANAMAPPVSPEVPSDLFTVKISREEVPQRNLFQPYKAPEPKVEPVAAPPAEAPKPVSSLDSVMVTFKLSGLYLAETPEALVEILDEKKTYAIKPGSELKGLKVKSITAEGVMFTDGNVEQILK